MLLKEFCAENMERVPAAIDAGVKRIELCDNLACGGTSPSVGVVRAASRLCRERGQDGAGPCRACRQAARLP